MKYKAVLICPKCKKKSTLTEEEAILVVNEGLGEAKDTTNKDYYPHAVCFNCDLTFLIDENMNFEKQ
jgi:predicted nucleic-acid-binding Zn-ribbon protein